MKTIKVLFLIVFLTIPSVSEELILYDGDGVTGSALCSEYDMESPHAKKYQCSKWNLVKKKIILKNTSIELETAITGYIEYVPKNIRRVKILPNKANDAFLNDINKMTLAAGTIFARFCYEINIYDHGNLITTFGTDGNRFYDKKNSLMYISREDLLRKHWGILEENLCR